MARFTRIQNPSYDTQAVFAAACAAQRHNGEYLKQDDITLHYDGNEHGHTVNRTANKTLVRQILAGASTVEVNDLDREEATKVIQYCNSLTFKILSGAKLSAFENTMIELGNKETISSNYDIAVIASLPASYERGMKRKQVELRIREADGHVGAIGDRFDGEVEVLRSSFSDNWGVYFITALTDDNKAVFFSFRVSLTPGIKVRVVGTVKAHRDNTTQLTRTRAFG